MYLHIGGDAVVRKTDILGIFDLDNSTTSSITRDFLRKAEEAQRVQGAPGELPKSFVLCEEAVFLSQLSSAALGGRFAQTNI